MSVPSRGSWWALMPRRTVEPLGPTAEPYSSAMQISPDWSGAASSRPTSHAASMQVGSGVARSRASTSPLLGVYGRRVGTAVATRRWGRWRWVPRSEPTPPENDPVWRFDTRSSPSSGRQAGWSASIRSRSTPGSRSYRAADRSGVVHCGR
jgi:hypothetical protein